MSTTIATSPENAPPHVGFLGIEIDVVTKRQLTSLVASSICDGGRRVIAHHNLHSLYLFHRVPEMQSFYQKAAFTHADGMSLVLLAKLLGVELSRENRIGYMDWIDDLMTAASASSWRLFYLGSKPGIAAQGAAVLRDRYPGLQIEVADGYFDQEATSADCREMIEAINAYCPHILFVGMGMPRQERWIAERLDAIQGNVILPCGAFIDYVAGVIPTPPRWLGRLGFEWLYRLISEPRRLGHRYLVEPWFLPGLMWRYWRVDRAKSRESSPRTYTRELTRRRPR